MSGKSFVEFYGEHQISPVNYRLTSLEKHFAIRKALYRYLGILPAHLKGRRVLEIGPGSGYNALYTTSLEPAVYDMVEPNPTGVATIKEVFDQYGMPLSKHQIHPVLIQDFPIQEPYDFVLCEGVIGGQQDPSALLERVVRHVAPGGVLVITTIDQVSFFADLLRRLLGRLLVDPQMPFKDKVARLVPIFKPHLDALPGMNRHYDDWVVDNLLNPAGVNPLFSMADAFATLGNRFEFLGSSPAFFTDWTWYKALQGGLNEKVMTQYWQNLHNLLDYRKTWPPRDEAANRKIYDACQGFQGALGELERGDRDAGLRHSKVFLTQLIGLTGSFAPELAEALTAYLVHLDVLNPKAIAADKKLGPWFGRGQQNISFSQASLNAQIMPSQKTKS